MHALQYHAFGYAVLPLCLLSVATLVSSRATRLFEWLETLALRMFWPLVAVFVLYSLVRVLVHSEVVSGSSASGLSSFFAAFNEPGFFDFISESLFKMGSL